VPRIREEVGFGSNYTLRLDGHHSNYVLSTSNILVNRIREEVGFGSNYTLRLDGHHSNYVLSTSNILADMIKNNKSSQWTTSNNMIYYNTSNVGIGTFAPTSKLHLFDDSNSETKLTIHNNYNSEIIANPVANISGIIAGTKDKYMIFKSGSSFTVPSGGINCDILMIGGGGMGLVLGGGGGAGACIVAINQILDAGPCIVTVGAGDTGTGRGGESIITVNGNIRYLARGGGRGGGRLPPSIVSAFDGGCGGGIGRIQASGPVPVSTNIVNGSLPNIGPTGPTTTGLNYVVLGNRGGNNETTSTITAGGGGIGQAGGDYTSTSGTTSGKGGDGLNAVTINGTPYNFKSYFANGGDFGVDNGYIGGGGGGNNGNMGMLNGGIGGGGYGKHWNEINLLVGQPNTGSGGGSHNFGDTDFGYGGSGIVIIRYRNVISPSSSIELLRGTSIDSNTDYIIGNYNGDFKIKSSLSGTDTDRLVLSENGNITLGGSINATSYLLNNVNISDTNISTSNILVNRIREEVGFGSNYTLRSSQWTTSNNMIYYNTSNIGIGTFAPTSKLHLFDNTITENKLIIQNNFQEFSSTTTPTFTNGGPSTSGNITTTANSPDKFMIFTGVSINHTFTVPASGINCDILMIGGGGQSQGEGGGGSGACIVAINQTLPGGTCVVNVGNYSSDSFIQVDGIDRYRAKAGAFTNAGETNGTNGGCGSGGNNRSGTDRTGGAPVATNIVNGSTATIGPTITSTYAVLGNAGGSSGGASTGGGGGGIGEAGASPGKGGDGAYQVTLAGSSTPYNFQSYFANGGTFGVNGYIGGGGGGYSGGYKAGGAGGGANRTSGPVNAISNTGSGGAYGATAGSGIIIIRYRNYNGTSSSSIELLRGTAIDSNIDYKIGNYGGDFKIISSLSNADTERFLLQSSDGSFIFKSTTGTSIATLTNLGNLTTTGTITNNSDSRIKKDIEDINNNNALDMILAIKPKTYKFIDDEKGKLLNYGFIAQEIKKIFPEATDICKDFLPNIMKIAICDNNKIYLDLTNYTDVPLNENDRKINIKFKNGGGDNFNITEINSEYFVVNKKTFEKDSNIIKFIDCPNGEVFVYGYEVNDFQILMKDYIYTLNVSATQELHKKIETQDARIKELEDKLERILGNN